MRDCDICTMLEISLKHSLSLLFYSLLKKKYISYFLPFFIFLNLEVQILLIVTFHNNNNNNNEEGEHKE